MFDWLKRLPVPDWIKAGVIGGLLTFIVFSLIPNLFDFSNSVMKWWVWLDLLVTPIFIGWLTVQLMNSPYRNGFAKGMLAGLVGSLCRQIPFGIRYVTNPSLVADRNSLLLISLMDIFFISIVSGLVARLIANRQPRSGEMDVYQKVKKERPYFNMQERGDYAGLIAGLKNRDDDVVVLCANLLAQNGVASAGEPLTRLLKHKSPRVRRVAASSIGRLASEMRRSGRLPDSTLVPPLIAALDDPEARNDATSALKQFDDPRAIAALGTEYDAEAARNLASRMNDRSLDIGLRQDAASKLGEMAVAAPRGEARNGLIDALIEASTSVDGPVRYSAVTALSRAADPHSFDALVRALGDTGWMVRGAAAEGLAALHDTRAIPDLEKLSHSSDDSDRASAQKALKTLRG